MSVHNTTQQSLSPIPRQYAVWWSPLATWPLAQKFHWDGHICTLVTCLCTQTSGTFQTPEFPTVKYLNNSFIPWKVCLDAWLQQVITILVSYLVLWPLKEKWKERTNEEQSWWRKITRLQCIFASWPVGEEFIWKNEILISYTRKWLWLQKMLNFDTDNVRDV